MMVMTAKVDRKKLNACLFSLFFRKLVDVGINTRRRCKASFYSVKTGFKTRGKNKIRIA